MKMLRAMTTGLLVLLFAVTSVAFGVARGAAHPVQAVVICQGYAT